MGIESELSWRYRLSQQKSLCVSLYMHVCVWLPVLVWSRPLLVEPDQGPLICSAAVGPNLGPDQKQISSLRVLKFLVVTLLLFLALIHKVLSLRRPRALLLQHNCQEMFEGKNNWNKINSKTINHKNVIIKILQAILKSHTSHFWVLHFPKITKVKKRWMDFTTKALLKI